MSPAASFKYIKSKMKVLVCSQGSIFFSTIKGMLVRHRWSDQTSFQICLILSAGTLYHEDATKMKE